jgi:hypothetical protein
VAFLLQRFITANSHPLFEDAQATVLVWIKTHILQNQLEKLSTAQLQNKQSKCSYNNM